MLYERIRELCRERGISISQLERELGFGKGSISKIDKHKPSMDKMQKMADFLGVSVYDLTEDNWYEDDRAREYVLFLKDHPEYRVLFDASRKVKPEDIALVRALIERFNNGNV